MLPSVADPDPVPTPEQPRSRAWPWVALGLALVWVVVLRVPLVLNARAHLDSDLAVDGLVLLDATQGKFRWHYPGTPFIGSIPVVLSLGPGVVVGVGPGSLVAGGVVAFGLLVGATFWLNWRAFGPSGGGLGVDPVDVRVDGGDLAVGADHGRAPADGGLARGGVRAPGRGLAARRRVAAGERPGALVRARAVRGYDVRRHVGGLAVAVAVGGWWGAPRPRSVRRALASLLAFAVAAGVGVAPRFVGRRSTRTTRTRASSSR